MTRTGTALMAVTVVNSSLGYLFWTAVARSFPAAEVGIANVVISTAVLIAILADLGMRTVVIQELPQARDGRSWSRWVSTCSLISLTASTVLAVAGAATLAFLSRDIGAFLTGAWAIVFVVLAVVSALSNLLDGIAIAERSPAMLISRNAATAVAKLVIFVCLLVLTPLSWRLIVLSTLIATLAGVLYGYRGQRRWLHREWRFSPAGTTRTARSLRRSMVGHYLLNLGGQLPMYLLPVEVVVRVSAQANAYMSLTWLVGGAFFLVSPAVSSALFAQGRWEPSAMRATTVRAAKLIAVLLLPVMLFMIAFGRPVLAIFGSQYARNGYWLLVVLAISAVPDAVTNVQIAVLRARKRLAEAAILNLLMAVTALAVAWLLLPHIGIVAVGIAWLIAQTGGSLACIVLRRSALGRGETSNVHAQQEGAGSPRGGRHRRFGRTAAAQDAARGSV